MQRYTCRENVSLFGSVKHSIVVTKCLQHIKYALQISFLAHFSLLRFKSIFGTAMLVSFLIAGDLIVIKQTKEFHFLKYKKYFVCFFFFTIESLFVRQLIRMLLSQSVIALQWSVVVRARVVRFDSWTTWWVRQPTLSQQLVWLVHQVRGLQFNSNSVLSDVSPCLLVQL